MEVKSEFQGEYISVNDNFKMRGILLPRDAVKDILDSETVLSSKLLKMIQKKNQDEEIMRELPDGIMLRIGLFKEQLRVDIRETTIVGGDLTFLKSGVNISVLNFLQLMRQLRTEYDKKPPVSSKQPSCDPQTPADDDEADESQDSPPPAKKSKPQQTLSKNHHPKGAKSFRKNVKAIKRKATVVTSDEDSN